MPTADAALLADRCGPIELIVCDVDGVLTDGVIAVDDRGIETKHFYVRDGSAIALWRRAARRVAILSGRRAACVDLRAAELGIAPVLQGVGRKPGPFRALLTELALQPRQVCYIGDDLLDLPVLSLAGLAACPADAIPEVRAIAHLITTSPGGRGAVREVIETILKAQSKWTALVDDLTTDDRPTAEPRPTDH
jgi:3-deoxy-D-manno-octulosonate 8-phosphate phosphatase (KDO 8-P phosphatase)